MSTSHEDPLSHRSNSDLRIVIVTGMSGAGKSLALRVLEDAGFTAIDNISPDLLVAVADHAAHAQTRRIAVVIDSRSGESYKSLLNVLAILKGRYEHVCMVFLDATDDVLVQRYKESRRPHPLFSPDTGVLESIRSERELLEGARQAADRSIDTSSLTVPEMRMLLEAGFADPALKAERLTTTVTTFGFKHGIPLDSDLVFDVRFLRNPYWIPELKHLDGTAESVREYIAGDPNTELLIAKIYDLVSFSLPQYQREGKVYLTISIGCTGGQHRSVAVGEALAGMLRDNGYRVLLRHRDIGCNEAKEAPA